MPLWRSARFPTEIILILTTTLTTHCDMLSLAQHTTHDAVRGMVHIGLGLVLSGTVYALSGSHVGSLGRYFFAKPVHLDNSTASRVACDLDFAPWEMNWLDRGFLLVFGVLYKAVKGAFGDSLGLQDAKQVVELPRLDISCPVTVNAQQTQLYERAVALDQPQTAQSKDAEGITEPFLLAAMTNQLMVLLVVHPRLPVSPLGGVNVRNQIHLSPATDNDACSSLRASASVGGKHNLARVVKRGIEFDICVEVRSSSSNQLILRQIITILAPCKTHIASSTATAAGTTPDPAPQYDTIGQINMPSSAPRIWSRVCGDYNPIHVSSLLAKLFGFRGKIAHGNHVVARTLNLLDSKQPGGRATRRDGGKGWWIEMQFRRPMVLPIRLGVQVQRASQTGNTSNLQWQCVSNDGKPHISGSIARL